MECCDICYSFQIHYIIICKNGHSLCHSCRQKIRECPFCLQPCLSLLIPDRYRSEKATSMLLPFYQELKKGKIREIDARDKKKNWYPARIITLDQEMNKIKVHFYGWDSRWDEWIPIESNYCLPLHTLTHDFISSLCLDQKVEYKLSKYSKKPKWYIGQIMELEKNYCRISSSDKMIKIPRNKNWLCSVGTHIKSDMDSF